MKNNKTEILFNERMINMKKNRYMNDTKLRNAYENAYDCHYYGMGSSDWVDCGIPKEMRAIVWNRAFWDCAEPDNNQDDYDDPIYA